MKNKKIIIGIIAALVLILAAYATWYFILSPTASHKDTGTDSYAAAILACYPKSPAGAENTPIPNNSIQYVKDTTRLFINMPKDLYPKDTLHSWTTISGNATGGYISNGGLPGEAFEATPECWSTQVELDGNGEVDLRVKSVIEGVPDYFVRFIVSPASTSAENMKVYANPDRSISATYPSTATVHERTVDQDGYFEVAFDDAATQARYVLVQSYSRQSDIDNVMSYFTGPYPKVVPASGNLPSQTAIERTLNGMKGVEVYGRGAEGHGFNDQFFYIADGKLWIISLNPIIEGRATPDEVEPGTPAPTEEYMEIYKDILETITI